MLAIWSAVCVSTCMLEIQRMIKITVTMIKRYSSYNQYCGLTTVKIQKIILMLT
jgi:hypothetical protein